MRKCLYILSPSDRVNYGDMLFPYILRHYLGSSVDVIENCSTSESNFESFGALPTKGYDTLFHADSSLKNFLIVAGGESLFVDWLVVLSFVHQDVHFLLNKIADMPRLFVAKSLAYRLLRLYAKIKYHVKTKFPFAIGLFELKNYVAIMYNSVGCVGLQQNVDVVKSNACKKILKSSSYISVSDSSTSRAIDTMGVSHKIIPDSAILMSEVFSDEFLETHRRSKSFFYKGEYIFFQINKLSSKGKESFFASILNDAARKYNKKILLCPIGTALGHEDDVSLREIANYLD